MATLSQDQKQLVQEKAKAIRVSIVQSVTAAKSGHPGGSLSIADVMSLLYFVEMNVVIKRSCSASIVCDTC